MCKLEGARLGDQENLEGIYYKNREVQTQSQFRVARIAHGYLELLGVKLPNPKLA